MNQFITTQLVEVDADNGKVVRVMFPSLTINGSTFYADIDRDCAERELHSVEQTQFGIGLALEGMKHGLRFRRPQWPLGGCIGLVDGHLHYCNEGGPVYRILELGAADVVAEDWVVAP